jgi:hypothetical protein
MKMSNATVTVEARTPKSASGPIHAWCNDLMHYERHRYIKRVGLTRTAPTALDNLITQQRRLRHGSVRLSPEPN